MLLLPEAMQNGLVTYSTDGGVAVIALNSPPANAYSYEMNRDLDEAVLGAHFGQSLSSRWACTAKMHGPPVRASASIRSMLSRNRAACPDAFRLPLVRTNAAHIA